MNDPAEQRSPRLVRLAKGPLLGIIVLAVAGAAAYGLIKTSRTPTRIAFPQISPIVELAPLVRRRHSVDVVGFGEVRAREEVSLRPQVAGMIVETAENLHPGGRVRVGDVLVRIDPRDYQFTVERQRARVAQARASLDLEQGQQRIAQSEWDLISERLDASAANRGLALREPQLQQARAALTQSRTELETAQLNLERTSLAAPFNAVVIAETVDLGDVVSVNQETAILAGTDEFWVEVQIGQDDATRLGRAFAAAPEGRLAASVVQRQGRAATMISLLSNLAVGSRLATAIVQIDDPLLLAEDADPTAEPVFLGAYVEVHIEAGELTDSYEIASSAVHENNIVWVRDADCNLAFRAVEPLLVQGEYAYVNADFEDGDALVLTRIGRAVPGLRIITAEEAAAQRRARFQQGGGPGGPGGGGPGGGGPGGIGPGGPGGGPPGFGGPGGPGGPGGFAGRSAGAEPIGSCRLAAADGSAEPGSPGGPGGQTNLGGPGGRPGGPGGRPGGGRPPRAGGTPPTGGDE